MTLKKPVRPADRAAALDDDSGESDTEARIPKKRKTEAPPPTSAPPAKVKIESKWKQLLIEFLFSDCQSICPFFDQREKTFSGSKRRIIETIKSSRRCYCSETREKRRLVKCKLFLFEF